MKSHDLSTYEGLLGAIEELTPWGSEFYRDPEHCMDYLARQREMIKEGVKENQRLRPVVEAAARLRDCFGATGIVHGEPDRHFVEVTDTQAAIALIDAIDAFMATSDAATDEPRIGKTHTAEMLEHE